MSNSIVICVTQAEIQMHSTSKGKPFMSVLVTMWYSHHNSDNNTQLLSRLPVCLTITLQTTSVTNTHQTFLWGRDSQISLSEQLSTLSCHAYGCKNVPWLIWIWVGLTPYSCWCWDFWLYLIWQRTTQEANRLSHYSEASDIFAPGPQRTQTQLLPEISKLFNSHKQACKLRL